MQVGIYKFSEVWLEDFEFSSPAGEHPEPICLVAYEVCSGRLLRFFQDGLKCLKQPPYPSASDSLVVSYFSSAEMGCRMALGWPPPDYVLDLYTEFRNLTNGLPTPAGAGLLGALAFFGLDALEGAEKESMRRLALRGSPFAERSIGLRICQSPRRKWAR